MSGSDDVDPVKCLYYAQFASHLHRGSFDVIYWLLFLFVVLMLFLSSWRWRDSHEKAQKLPSGSAAHKRTMKKCLCLCLLYSCLSVVAVVMEVYVLLALQFCDGEDLMSLYWSTWTTLQLGGLIAMLGIVLANVNEIRGNKSPPWALAMGTPVLVVAGIGHFFHGSMKKRVARARSARSRSRSRKASVQSSGGDGVSLAPMPTNNTTRTTTANDESKEGARANDDDVDLEQGLPPPSPSSSGEEDGGDEAGTTAGMCQLARLVGHTSEGDPVLEFFDDVPPSFVNASAASVLGRTPGGNVLVSFSRSGGATIRYVAEQDKGRRRQRRDDAVPAVRIHETEKEDKEEEAGMDMEAPPGSLSAATRPRSQTQDQQQFRVSFSEPTWDVQSTSKMSAKSSTSTAV